MDEESIAQQRQKFEQKRIDCQLENQRDKLYIAFLRFLGGCGIAGATIMIIIDGLLFSPSSLAILAMGAVMIGFGSWWQNNNLRRLNEVEQEIADLSDMEMQSIKIG